MNPVIQFQNVSKRYILGSRRTYLNYLLPGRLSNKKDQGSQLSSVRNVKENELWALDNVSFDVSEGEVLGVIGPNGAGKTTTLSLLAGITSPTAGRIKVRGQVGALIRLGAGFHPDLSGRENVFLNGSILGLKRREIERLYEDIVSFAELEEFMDTPVKRYSSGMYVRLGFAVAIHINPEILLVDEILSVGDVSFQSRCLNRIGEIRDSGTAILLVSHNMHQIASFCDRVVYLNHGKIQKIGEPGTAIAQFTDDLMVKQINDPTLAGSDMAEVNGSGRLIITNVSFLDDAGNEIQQIISGNPVTVRVEYRCNESVINPLLDVVIRDASRGNMFQATNRDFGFEFGQINSDGFIDIHFPNIPSNNQVLDFFFTLWNTNHTEQFDWKRFIKLKVIGNPTTSGRFLFNCNWNIVEGERAIR